MKMIRLIYKDCTKKKFEKFGSLYSRCISCEEMKENLATIRLTSIQFNSENPWGKSKIFRRSRPINNDYGSTRKSP